MSHAFTFRWRDGGMGYCSWAAEPDRRVSIRQMPTLSPRGGMPMIVREL